MNNAHLYHARIYLDDTDAGGITYHANHLKYMARARQEWLRDALPKSIATQPSQGAQFVVAKCSIAYQAPLLLDEAITLHTRLIHLRRASLVVEQSIYKGALGLGELAGARLATKADITLAYVDVNLKPTPLDTSLIDKLKANVPS